MTETARPDSGLTLSRENIQQLSLATLALFGRDSRPTLYVDEHNNPRGARLARLGPSPGSGVVFLEFKADERLPPRRRVFRQKRAQVASRPET